MPVEPPPSAWVFPPPDQADEYGLVGVGADLDAGTLLAGYRHGLFPMPTAPGDLIAWWSPDPRGVLELDALRVTRSMRRSARRFEVRVDTAFDEVVAGCADPARPHGWIDEHVRAAYSQLHALGWAHSVEAWDDEGLAGGLYGVAVGGLFAGESMFHRRTDASKVALMGLVSLLTEADEPRLIDVQWLTPHLERLGATELPRSEYLRRVRLLTGQPSRDWPVGVVRTRDGAWWDGPYDHAAPTSERLD